MKNIIKAILKKKDGGKLSQYLAVLSGCLVNLVVGFHYNWTTPSLKKLMSDEYPFEITEDEASYITIVAPIGHVIGGITGSFLSDLIGRKWSILAISCPQVCSFLLYYFSMYAKELLYIGRIAGGIGEGAVVAVLPTYIAEVADPEIRGILGVCATLAFLSGGLFINLVGSYLNIHTTALICLIFPVLLWLTFINMPESPYFLLMKHKKEAAISSLKILRRQNTVEKEIDSLEDDVRRQMSEKGNLQLLFTNPANRKAFLLISFTRTFQQFTGCSAFSFYLQILLAQSTDLSPIMGSSLLFIIQMITSTSIFLFVDRIGRKPLFVWTSVSIFIVLSINGIFIILKDFTSIDLSFINWFPLLMMVLFMIFYTAGVGGIINVLASELYSNSIKAKGLAMGSIIFAATMMSSTKYYQVTADNISQAVPFLTFAICTLIGALFFHFILPETKGKTLEQIQQQLKGNKK